MSAPCPTQVKKTRFGEHPRQWLKSWPKLPLQIREGVPRRSAGYRYRSDRSHWAVYIAQPPRSPPRTGSGPAGSVGRPGAPGRTGPRIAQVQAPTDARRRPRSRIRRLGVVVLPDRLRLPPKHRDVDPPPHPWVPRCPEAPCSLSPIPIRSTESRPILSGCDSWLRTRFARPVQRAPASSGSVRRLTAMLPSPALRRWPRSSATESVPSGPPLTRSRPEVTPASRLATVG